MKESNEANFLNIPNTSSNTEIPEKVLLPLLDLKAPLAENDRLALDELAKKEDGEFVKSIRPLLRTLMKKIREVEGESVKADKTVFHMLPHISNRNVENPLVVLPGKGCTYQEATGGCTMCNFGCEGRDPNQEDVDKALNFIFAHNKKMWAENPDYRTAIVNLNVPGTFFNDKELHPSLRDYAFRRVREFQKETGNLTVFVCEGRLDLVSQERMENMREQLGPDVIVDIGVGLESTDELIREGITNKGLPKDWAEKAEMMKSMGDTDLTVHINMGMPFLNQAEIIKDATESLTEITKMRDESGDPIFDQALLMVMNQRKGTLLDYLARCGKYKLPNIFATAQVLTSLSEKLDPSDYERIRIGGLVGPENLVESGTLYQKPCRPDCSCGEVFETLRRFKSKPEDVEKLKKAVEAVGEDCELKSDFRKKEPEVPLNREDLKKEIAKTYLQMLRKFYPETKEQDLDTIFNKQ